MNFLLRHYPKTSFSTLGVGLEGRSVLFWNTLREGWPEGQGPFLESPDD